MNRDVFRSVACSARRCTARARSETVGRSRDRWFAALTVSTVLVIASSGIAWASAAGAAPVRTRGRTIPRLTSASWWCASSRRARRRRRPRGVTDPSEADRTLAPGYVEKEFLVQGDASTYRGPVTGPVKVAQTNVPYSTRVLVRYPKDASKFSGRVVVEPFNTSNNGSDLDAVWSLMAPMLQKRGDAWVGVTERTSAGQALKQADPTRYAAIDVPSNDVAWDVLAQVGAAVKQGWRAEPAAGPQAQVPLHGRLFAERRRHCRVRDRSRQALRHSGREADIQRLLPCRARRQRHSAEGGNGGAPHVRVSGHDRCRRARREPRGRNRR